MRLLRTGSDEDNAASEFITSLRTTARLGARLLGDLEPTGRLRVDADDAPAAEDPYAAMRC